MATQIDDPNTIVPCSECGQPVAVKDAIIVAKFPAHPERGVYLFCSKHCQERHAIAAQVLPIIRALPPIADEAEHSRCMTCGNSYEECECEPEW